MKKLNKIKLVCSQCGGTNVQVHAWVDANSNKYIGDDMCDDGDTWCSDCEEHSGLMTEDEFNNNRVETNEET